MAEQPSGDEKIQVEVAYAKPFEQKILAVMVAKGTTVYEVVRQSGIVDCFPEIELDSAKLGLFGKVVPKPREQLVKEGDRVEVYRPLIADPREVRKKRAEQARLKKQNQEAPSSGQGKG